MASAAKNTIYYAIGSIFRALTSFVLLPIYANMLGTSQYGILNLLQTFTAIIAPLMSLSVEKSIYRLYFDYKTDDSKQEFLSTVFWSINITSLFVIAACILSGQLIANLLGGVDVTTVFYPLLIYTYLSALVTYCQIILQTQQKGLAYLLVSMVLLIVYNLVALLLLFNWSQTYKSEVYASFIAYPIVLIVGFLFIRNQIRFKYNLNISKQIISYSMPLFLVSLFSWILSASDRFFIANIQNTSDVGLYSMAFKIVSMAVMFGASIKQAYDPYFYNISNSIESEQAKIKIKPINDTMVFLTSMLFLIVILFGKLFVKLYLAPEYQQCIVYLYFLTLSCFFTQQMNVLNPMILQNKKTGLISLITITGGGLSMLLNMVLIPKYGSLMAAVDSVVVGLYMFCLTWYFAKKNFYIKIHVGNICGFGLLFIICYIIDMEAINEYFGFCIKLIIIIGGIAIFNKISILSFPALGLMLNRLMAKLTIKDNK